jgi:predicted RNA-binding protein Jag
VAKRGVKLEELPGLVSEWASKLGLHLEASFAPSGNEALFPNRLLITGPDVEHLLAERGQPLDALQHLLQEAQHERDEAKQVWVDANGIRLFRMKEVIAMARMAAEKAREIGSYTFGAMSPRERRWIHLTIASLGGDLSTESEGTGHFKPVKVIQKA